MKFHFQDPVEIVKKDEFYPRGQFGYVLAYTTDFGRHDSTFIYLVLMHTSKKEFWFAEDDLKEC